jgi:hypothetical protein
MTLETYTSEVEKLLTDSSIISYFTSNQKSIIHFVKTYIEVDKILGCNTSNSNILYNKLDEIKHFLNQQNNQLNNLSSKNTILQTKLESIKDTSNNDKKNYKNKTTPNNSNLPLKILENVSKS